MTPVELDPEAAEELRQAIDYLEARRPGSGDEFEQAVRDALDMIGQQPKAFAPYRARYRKYVVTKFGYLIFYVELSDHIWVAAIASGKRRPGYWMNRQPK